MQKNSNLPIYSLANFSNAKDESKQYQVEVFDANRHFQVTYPHRHDFYEILFLAKGSGLHVIDSQTYSIETPCVFFMTPGQAHKLELSNDIGGYIFLFTADFYLMDKSDQNRLLEFPFFFNLLQDNPPLLLHNCAELDFLEMLFLQAVKTNAEKYDHTDELQRSFLDTLLVLCASLYSHGQQTVLGRGHLLVKRFLLIVEETFRQNLSVNEYADMLHITPNHLTQSVKLLTGKTSSEIIQAKQILEIKRLLVHTTLGMTEIAGQMGFTDQSYFTKFFKKQVAMTPLQFRKSKHL